MYMKFEDLREITEVAFISKMKELNSDIICEFSVINE